MSKNAAYQVGVITVAAQSSITIAPLFSDQAYRNVCIGCTPLGSGPSYLHKLELYLDGILKETHDDVTGAFMSTQMLYGDQIYPPNLDLLTRPDMQGFEPSTSIGFTLKITNNEAEARSFTVYSTFEMYMGTACRRLKFDEIRS